MSGTTAKAPELARFVTGFKDLAGLIDVLICDVWGVVHNGQTAHLGAVRALETFRSGGGTVIMVSNSPRPSPDVIPQLLGYGVATSAFDKIITSGDLTRQMIIERAGQSIVHLGPNRDHTLFAGLDIRLAPAQTADYCICTGFEDDETQTPADYAGVLDTMARRGLVMICANPDLIVERGHKLIPCAGAMAAAYERLGGRTVYAGKPHPAVYRQALVLAGEVRGPDIDMSRVAAVGDAIRTDIAGAGALGVRSILLLDGIHWGDVGRENWQDGYEAWLARQDHQPTHVMTRLTW